MKSRKIKNKKRIQKETQKESHYPLSIHRLFSIIQSFLSSYKSHCIGVYRRKLMKNRCEIGVKSVSIQKIYVRNHSLEISLSFYIKNLNLSHKKKPMPQIQLRQQITRPQRRLFCITKYQIRLLLGRGEGVPMAETTWHRFWKAKELPQKLGMSETEFSRCQVFYLDDFQKLKTIIGFDDADLHDL